VTHHWHLKLLDHLNANCKSRRPTVNFFHFQREGNLDTTSPPPYIHPSGWETRVTAVDYLISLRALKPRNPACILTTAFSSSSFSSSWQPDINKEDTILFVKYWRQNVLGTLEIFSRPYLSNGRAVLMVVIRLSVCHGCTVAKRCKIKPNLLLI